MSKNPAQFPESDLQGFREIMDGLVGYHLRRVQQAAFQHFSDSLPASRITPGQFAILVFISDNRGISQTALAKEMGVQRATLGEVIDRLEKRGLVVRGRTPGDRRSYALKLTEQGADYLARLLPQVLGQEDSFTHALTAPERQQLLSLLRKLTY